MLWRVASGLLNKGMTGSTRPPESISVIGAGIIGLACALELADRGLKVSLYDPNWPPRGASWAAAGMLAPAFEAAGAPDTHPDLFALCLTSARLWPAWAEALETRSGMPSGFVPGPSLAVARDVAQAEHLESIANQLHGPDAPQAIRPDQLALFEPAIQAELIAALLLPSDGQVDNRLTMAALIACIHAHPRIEVIEAAAPLTRRSGRSIDAGQCATLITAGWQSAQVAVTTAGAQKRLVDLVPVLDRIRAFGGQMLSLSPVENSPTRPIRCGDLYIVPKQDRIIIGATTEPGRVLSEAEPEMIAHLHARAAEICPALKAAVILDQWAGVRPGTSDHAPILGQIGTETLYIAAGHYRNGILLAPVTAQIMADLIMTGTAQALAPGFAPSHHRAAQV